MSKPTSEQIAAWKEQYGNLFLIQVEDQELYIKDPYSDERIIKLAIAAARKGLVQYTLAIANNCLLHGDRKLLEDVGTIEAIKLQVSDLVEPPYSSVEKKDRIFEITCEGQKLEFREPSREDLITAETRNPSGMPLETEIALLSLCAVDPQAFSALRKSHVKAWIGMVLEANTIKEVKRATVVKL